MEMLLGISSFAYGWSIGWTGQKPARPMTMTNLIDTAVALELRCLQFGDNMPVHTFSQAQLEELKSRAKHNALRLEIGARELTKGNLERYLALAILLDAALIRFIIDGPGYEPSSEETIEIIKDFLPKLKKTNITLGIENHDRFKARELAAIIGAIGDDQVGICLDCVNSMGAGEGLEHVLDVLAPYTVNLHVKDFKIDRLPHKMGFSITGAAAGTGMTNMSLLMAKLSQYKRCQSAVLEQWVPQGATIEETIDTEKLWAKQGITYLKTLLVSGTNN